MKKSLTLYPTKSMTDLFKAIGELRSEAEIEAFCRDLLTIAELTEFANRWQMVKLLVKGESYIEIAKKLHTSTATVTRVAHWLHEGMGGYKLMADRLWKPVRDERPVKNRMAGKRRFAPTFD